MKKLLCLALSLALLLSAAGCGGKESKKKTNGGIGSASTSDLLPEFNITNDKLTVLTHWSIDDVKHQEANAKLKANYGLNVEFVTVDWNDLGTRLTSMVLSDMSPDVYLGRYMDYPMIGSKNLIQPLDDIIDFSNPLFNYTKESQKTVQSNGKNWAVVSPDRVGWILWYNERMFEEAGLDTPRELYWDNNWNWDTFLNAALELTDVANGIYGVGMTGNYILPTTGVTTLKYDSNTGKLTNNLRDPLVVKGMNFLSDLTHKHKVLSPDTEGIQAFSSGKLAMLMDGDWLEESQLLEQCKRNNVNFVPIPKCPDTDKYFVQQDYDPLFSIPVGAKNVEGAKAYILNQLFSRVALCEKSENADMLAIYQKNEQRRISVLGNDEEDLKMQASYGEKLSATHIVSILPEFSTIVNQMTDQMKANGTSWETLVEKNYATLQAYIDDYNAGLS